MKIKIKDIRQSKNDFSIFLPRHVICLINTSLSLVTIPELQKLQKRNNVLSLRLSIEDKDLYTLHMIKPKLNTKLDLLLTALDIYIQRQFRYLKPPDLGLFSSNFHVFFLPVSNQLSWNTNLFLQNRVEFERSQQLLLLICEAIVLVGTGALKEI